MTESLKPGRYTDIDGDAWEVQWTGDMILFQAGYPPLVYPCANGRGLGSQYALSNYGPFTPDKSLESIRDRVNEALDLDGDEAKLEAIMAIIEEVRS